MFSTTWENGRCRRVILKKICCFLFPRNRLRGERFIFQYQSPEPTSVQKCFFPKTFIVLKSDFSCWNNRPKMTDNYGVWDWGKYLVRGTGDLAKDLYDFISRILVLVTFALWGQWVPLYSACSKFHEAHILRGSRSFVKKTLLDYTGEEGSRLRPRVA